MSSLRLNLFFFYIFQDSVLKPTNPLCRPKRSAASPIKIMKSRIWEERWWNASTALWEQGWKWMGGRPQRCYRLISTMGCPTDPRCPTPGSHDIQGPTKSRSPTREAWRSYRFNWGLGKWGQHILTFRVFFGPSDFHSWLLASNNGIKAIIADHQNH